MATIALQKVGDGLDEVTFAAATGGGDEVAAGVELGGWSLPVLLLVANGDVGSHDVTVGGLPAVTVPAGATAAIQVNGGIGYGQPISVTYSAVTSVTVAALDLAD